MQRRHFLQGCGSGLTGLLAVRNGFSLAFGANPVPSKVAVIEADIAIIGGGLGGCAAALAALKAGCRVVLTEPTDWIGGQLTQQGVPPDEHPWIEKFGANASYLDLRRSIRDYYRRHYPVTREALDQPYFNPGNGSVSKLCCEPKVALTILIDRLAPYASSGKLTVLLEHDPISAEVVGDWVRSVKVSDSRAGVERLLTARYFLDASELGDLLPMTGAEFNVGFESRAETGDRSAPEKAQPENQQSFTCCFAMDYLDGEDHTIDPPEDYTFWRDYVPKLNPGWPGKLLGMEYSNPQTLEPKTWEFDPRGQGKGLWVYRRIIDPANFKSGTYAGGVTLVNWPLNDYWLGNLIGVCADDAAKHLDRAKQLSLSLLYWMQTEMPNANGGTGWKGLRLRRDLLGTADGLAKHPYIRESRRIQSEFTVLEKAVGLDARRAGSPKAEVVAEEYPDSVGIGSYRIDLHPSSGGNNYIDVSSLPFQIPLGALIPKRLENLLPACKNLGVTHITNGCYRLHPVEWAIGEASGSLAAFCIDQKLKPREVRNTPKHLKAFQGLLTSRGVEIAWPKLSPR